MEAEAEEEVVEVRRETRTEGLQDNTSSRAQGKEGRL